MTTHNIAPERQKLNPFVFPVETDLRFVLLVVAICMLAISMGLTLTGIFAPELNPTTIFQNDLIYPVESDPDYSQKLIAALLERSRQAFKSLGVHCMLVVTILIVSLVVFRTHPNRLRRRKNLMPISETRDSVLQREIQQLVQLTGISDPPSFEFGRNFQGQNGQAFGFRNRYAIRLDRGLRLLLRNKPGRFRAIVLHEMAHIVNKDIDRTYFAQSLWGTIIALAIVPLVLGVLGLSGFVRSPSGISAYNFQNLTRILIFIFQVIGTLALVALIRSSLLRVREMYADWRAAVWGAEDALIETFRESMEGAVVKSGLRRNPWRLHPTMQERVYSLMDPGHLFTITLDLPFLTGFVLALLIGGLINVVLPLTLIIGGVGLKFSSLAGSVGEALTYTMVVIGMVIPFAFSLYMVGYLISEIVGLQVLREAIAGLARQRRGLIQYLKLLTPSILLILGFETGFYLTPLAPDAPWVTRGAEWSSALRTIPWLSGSILLTWAWLVTVRFFGRRILGSYAGLSLSKRRRRLMVVLFSGMLAALYLPIIGSRMIITNLGMMTVPGRERDFPPDQVAFLENLIPATWVIGSTFFVLLFGVTWLMFQIYRSTTKTLCPSCKQTTQKRYTVGELCEHCGNDLAPWLFVN